MREVREARKREQAERAAKAKLQRERAKALADAEAEVTKLEAQQREITTALEGSEAYENSSLALKLNRDLMNIQRAIAEATARWDLLAEQSQPEEPVVA
jgi:hypothetical protein